MAGYSSTPLQRKLGIKAGYEMLVIEPIEAYFDLLGPLPEGVKVAKADASKVDFIHLFCKEEQVLLELLPTLKARLKPAGMLWLSWPKKASKIETDLNRELIREHGLNIGLVDVKVCAVDEDWSGLKFVFRVKDRGIDEYRTRN